MATDFSQYMNIPVGQMKRVTLPEGHYFGRVKHYEPKESTNGKPMLMVQFTLDSCGEDVDTTQLPEQGVSGKTVTSNYMLDTDFGRDDIRKMIEAVGVQMDPAQGWGQYLPQIKNQPVKLYIKQRPVNKDEPEGDRTEDIKKVLAAA